MQCFQLGDGHVCKEALQLSELDIQTAWLPSNHQINEVFEWPVPYKSASMVVEDVCLAKHLLQGQTALEGKLHEDDPLVSPQPTAIWSCNQNLSQSLQASFMTNIRAQASPAQVSCG